MFHHLVYAQGYVGDGQKESVPSNKLHIYRVDFIVHILSCYENISDIVTGKSC